MQWLHYNHPMPCIQRFAGCQINIYFHDHLPPHFHVLANNGLEWLMEIETGAILRGPRNTREIREALDWATSPDNRKLLLRRFTEMSQ